MDSTQLERTLSQFVKRYIASHGINSDDYDDFMNEARLAAHYAMKSYRDGKQASIKTYIIRCVRNRFIDIRKNCAYRFEASFLHEEVAESSYEPQFADFELDHDIRSIMNDRDFFIYRKIFVEGYTIAELKREKIAGFREAQSCFSRITRAYQLIVKNRNRISTSGMLLSRSSVSLQNSRSA